MLTKEQMQVEILIKDMAIKAFIKKVNKLQDERKELLEKLADKNTALSLSKAMYGHCKANLMQANLLADEVSCGA